MVRRWFSSWLAFCLPLAWLSASFGQAQDPREVEARKACLTGKHEIGITLLAELFAETGNPNFVYNQARCYEAGGHPVDAIQRFREYLRVAPEADAGEKADVERHITDCRATQAEQEKAVHAPPAVSAPAAATSANQAPPTAPRVDVAIATTEPATVEQNTGASLRNTGIVLGATAVAATAAGVVFSLLTNNIKNQVEADGRQSIFDPSKDARGKTYATLQWVCYGAGAVSFLTGAITYYHGSGHDGTRQTLALVPVVGAERGGFLLQGGF